jgi:methylated-DNA-[protein]-cysteine S-methyltransferase
MKLRMRTVASPIGPLRLFAAADQLVGLHFPGRPAPSGVEGTAAVLDQAAAQLDEYFAGRRRSFALPLAPPGTEFQRRVWDALQDIPCGETRSYGELARSLGRPAASRAVGAANGRNPISIIVPCHRLIGAGGDLTGYGGGIAAKRWLLALEAGDPERTSRAGRRGAGGRTR